MRIGVLLTAYNCESYIDDCLEPWLNLRDEYNFIIACNSGMFKDYLEMGIVEKNEGTLNKLVKKGLDYLTTISGKNLIDEDNSRDISLDFLNGGRFGRGNKCDLLIVIDGDEVFTEQNIRDILDFVMKNPNHDGYKINFKNHTINKDLFTYDYEHDRIFWMNRHGGIRRFWFDNNFEYGDHYDGISTYKYSDSITIPKSVAYIDHYSWLSTDSRTKDKILYQNKRYHGVNYEIPEGLRCGFEWDNEKDVVKFSSTFWPGRGIQIPILHQMTDGPYTFDFKLDFNRSENKLTIETFETNENCLFEIFDINNQHIYSCNLSISKGSNYWIMPSGNQFDLDETFEGFNVKVTKDGHLIHNENLYLKIKQ